MDRKPFNNCKVAVCLSGESRGFRECANSMKNFFSTRKNNQYHFFCHTWDANHYKIWSSYHVVKEVEEELLDIDILENDLKKYLNLDKVEVEKQFLNNCFTQSMLYSRMKANFLKQQYEVENNMMFDLVVRTRLDIAYKPNVIFEDYVSPEIEEKTLYSRYGFMAPEFFLPNPDEVCYWGTSFTMDIVDSLYNCLTTGAFDKIHNTLDINNLVYHKIGPGTLIHKWATFRNILTKNAPFVYAVYRRVHMLNKLDPVTQWDLIKNTTHVAL